MDPQSEFLALGSVMIISQRDHNVIVSDHINFPRIKHECSSCRFELDEIVIGDDAPPHTDWTAVRVNDLWELIVFIPVETNILICYRTVELRRSILYF